MPAGSVARKDLIPASKRNAGKYSAETMKTVYGA
jgi:hypothetical protein